MRTKFFVVMLTLSIILFSGSLSPDDNQEKIMWGDEKYCLEFKYLTETQPILKDLWDDLKAEEQKNKINDVKEPARDRYNEVKEYYDLMMSKWDIEETEKYLNSITDESIEVVRLWLGEKEALQLKKKKDTLKYLVEEAKISDIDKIDFKILEKYFKPEVISNIKGIKIEEEQKSKILNKGDNSFFKEVKKLSGKNLGFSELAHTYDGANLKGGVIETNKPNKSDILKGKVATLKGNWGPNTIKHKEIIDQPKTAENPKFDGVEISGGAKYKPVSGYLFVKNNTDPVDIHHNDINQGQLGDCYLLSSVAAVAKQNPDFIRNMVRQNPDNTYSVDFYQTTTGEKVKALLSNSDPKYKKVTVTVDNQFPLDKDNNPVFNGYGDTSPDGKPEVWGMVIEKAYAKLHGSYNEIDKGGWPSSAMEEITGKPSSEWKTTSIGIKDIAEWDKKGYAITVGSSKDPPNKDVVARHVYYVIDVDPVKKTITLGNPWGFNHITLSEEEFKKNFDYVFTNPIK